MEYIYALLLHMALIGSFSLLIIELFPGLHKLRKPAAAAWVTTLTLLWIELPTEGRWALSIWSPTTVLDGQLILDMTPAIWWCGLALGAALSGAAWAEVAERHPPLPLSGVLMLTGLLTVWLALTSGSLLTTLASWATFDLLWGVAGLMAGGESERVTFSLTIHSATSIILWITFLLLKPRGVSVLWWLMWPPAPMRTLLIIAALLRIGFYPFQAVFPPDKHPPSRRARIPQRTGAFPTLILIYLMGPILGIALVYRLLALPAVDVLPQWSVLWGVISLLWGGIVAWSQCSGHAGHGSPTSHSWHSMLWGGYGLLGIIVGGALVSGTEALLLKGTAVWIAAEALLITAQGRQHRAFIWSWPATLGLFFLLGIPPSPIGMLFRHLQDGLPWHWRILSVAGSVLIGAALLHKMTQKAAGYVPQPWPWQRLCNVIGYTLPLLIMVILPLAEQFPNVSPYAQANLHADANIVNPIDKIHPYKLSWTSLGLWIVSVLGAGALAFQSTRRVAYSKSSWLQNASPILDLLDFQWLYRALWRGIEHLLSILRISAEVFEGSGALLWSFLILMLVMLVVINS
jgi:hypothetical protein